MMFFMNKLKWRMRWMTLMIVQEKVILIQGMMRVTVISDMYLN